MFYFGALVDENWAMDDVMMLHRDMSGGSVSLWPFGNIIK
jgi:hypothetical protein